MKKRPAKSCPIYSAASCKKS